jgi:hypothetical protein
MGNTFLCAQRLRAFMNPHNVLILWYNITDWTECINKSTSSLYWTPHVSVVIDLHLVYIYCDVLLNTYSEWFYCTPNNRNIPNSTEESFNVLMLSYKQQVFTNITNQCYLSSLVLFETAASFGLCSGLSSGSLEHGPKHAVVMNKTYVG